MPVTIAMSARRTRTALGPARPPYVNHLRFGSRSRRPRSGLGGFARDRRRSRLHRVFQGRGRRHFIRRLDGRGLGGKLRLRLSLLGRRRRCHFTGRLAAARSAASSGSGRTSSAAGTASDAAGKAPEPSSPPPAAAISSAMSAGGAASSSAGMIPASGVAFAGAAATETGGLSATGSGGFGRRSSR